LGASELLVNVTDAPGSQMVSLGNTGSNITGPWSLTYSGSFNRPFNKAGALGASVTGTGGDLAEVRSYLGKYLTPIGSYGLLFSFGALFADAVPGGSIRELGIESKSQSFTPRLRYPILRSRANSVYIDAGFALNRSKTTIQGDTLTEDKTTVGEITLAWAQNGWLNGSSNYAVTMFKGLRWFGAMDQSAANPSVQGFDPTFTRYVLNLNRTQPLVGSWSLQFAGNAQYTKDKLISGELVSFGGPSIGRGYDPSAITGDRGAGALLELRYDSAFAYNPWFGNIQFYGFVDEAKVTSIASSTVDKTRSSLGSAGVGARFPVLKNHFIDVQMARSRFQAMTADARHDPRFLLNAIVRF
jgi:hemolysin activation/secretion protein